MMQRLLVALAAGLQLAAAIDPPRQPHQPTGNGTTILSYNVTVGKPGSLSPTTRSLSWVSSDNDGEYIFEDTDGALTFENIATGDQRVFVPADKIPADFWEYWISGDSSKVLWAVNYKKQYRHSYFADYLIQDVATGETQPLVADQSGDIQYAEWNPANADQIAFVRGNNLFIWNNGEISQITDNGGPDTFNGVPDWVYEEEIFGDRYTLWWSPDGEYIAYLSMDETGVETFTVPYYMDGQDVAPPYPRDLDIRYPKVGTKNPTVTFNLLNVGELKSTAVPIDAFPEDDLVIGEVAWVTEEHDTVIYRAFNRVQDQEKHVAVDVAAGSASVVRERDGTDGWLDNTISISYVGTVGNYSGSSETYYIDVSDESGWNHLYLFPVKGGDKIALTEGDWEVVQILKIDSKRGLIYYTSTEAHSTERHVYSVSYNTKEKKALVDDSVPAYWTASFSAGGTYYVLRYAGPDVPYQELYSINSTEPIRTIVDNKKLWDTLQTYKLPNITYMEMEHPDGYTLNAMLRLPANFDPSKKYPVLLTPYGGPGAQEVDKAFQPLNWNAYISSDPELEYISLTVDNRGTGYKGRKFRASVVSNLGELEAKDQVWAAKEIAKNSWVDADKIGIWGWSYGGYLSSKVLELNDPVISLGLITAPVSDWRFYDSMYTERYMKTPELNPEGYNRSRVHDTAGFNAVRGGFLVMHGTGDDNVHFQNAAALVDLLVGAGVSPEKMNVQWFTDSDHSIRYHGATQFLYRQLTKKLYEEKNREGDLNGGHQWSKRRAEAAAAAAAAAAEAGRDARAFFA